MTLSKCSGRCGRAAEEQRAVEAVWRDGAFAGLPSVATTPDAVSAAAADNQPMGDLPVPRRRNRSSGGHRILTSHIPSMALTCSVRRASAFGIFVTVRAGAAAWISAGRPGCVYRQGVPAEQH
jgi:hypothetical protein